MAEQVVAFLFSLMDQGRLLQQSGVCPTPWPQNPIPLPRKTAEIQQELVRGLCPVRRRVLSPSTDIEGVQHRSAAGYFSALAPRRRRKRQRNTCRRFRASRVNLPDGCKDAAYATAIANSYPFHPELFNLLTKKDCLHPPSSSARGVPCVSLPVSCATCGGTRSYRRR